MSEQIKIGADASGVLSELGKVKAAADSLNKALGSTDIHIRTDQAQKSLSSITAAAESARKALAAAGGAFDLDAQDQADAVDALRAILEDVARLAGGVSLNLDTTQARAQLENLRREVQKKPASSTNPASPSNPANPAAQQLDNERRRSLRDEREERNRLRRLGAEGKPPLSTGAGTAPTPGAGSPPNKPPPPAPDRHSGFMARLGQQMTSDPSIGRMGRVTGALGGIAGGLMSGSGSGGMMRSIGSGMGTLGGAAIGTMLGGPLGAVVGGLAGSLLSSIGGAAGGGIDEAMGDVIAEGLDLSNLNRAIGVTNTNFGELQHRLRAASDGLQTTFTEMAQHGRAFAKHAGYQGGAQELAEEVRHATGLARGLGIDPQAGLQFSASLRHTQASKSDQDSRKIGLAVAESIARGGLGPKADEMLSAIGHFANSATNQSLTAADVSSFASVLGAASATGIAGLAGNPANTAAIIGQADAAMRQGGAHGLASSVLTDSALRKDGMNFSDVNLLKEQGLFGTDKDAFGADSAVQKSIRTKLASDQMTGSERASLEQELARLEKLAASGDGRTNADKVLARLGEQTANQAEYREAVKSHFGLKTVSQAEAFDTMMRTHGGTGALSQRLQEAGVDTSNLDARSIGSLAEAFQAERSGLQRMGTDILNDQEFSSKNADVAKRLSDALGKGDTEALRNAIFQAKANGAGNMTEVERANQAGIDLKNEFMKYAQAILPVVTTSKEALLALVEKMAPNSDMAKQIRAEREIIQSGDAQRAAQMVAAGQIPQTEGVADLAKKGAPKMQRELEERVKFYDERAEGIGKNGWFLRNYRAANLRQTAQQERDRLNRLRGLGSAPEAGAETAPAPTAAAQAVPVPAPVAAAQAVPVPAPVAAAQAVPVPAPVVAAQAAPAPSAATGAAGGRIAATSNKRTIDFAPDLAHISGLSAAQTRSLLTNIASTESSAKNDYREQNYAGYLGRYQFGAEALADAGLIDKEKLQSAKAQAGRGWYGNRFTTGSAHADFLNHPDNWAAPGLRDQYMTNPDFQDAIMVQHTNRNLRHAARRGAITDASSAASIGGAAKAMHISGAGAGTNYILHGADRKDGLGTSTSKYYRDGFSAVAQAAPTPNSFGDAQPIPTGGKDGPGVQAASAQSQQTVKVISEITVRDQNGKERDDVRARPISYESLPAGAGVTGTW